MKNFSQLKPGQLFKVQGDRRTYIKTVEILCLPLNSCWVNAVRKSNGQYYYFEKTRIVRPV